MNTEDINTFRLWFREHLRSYSSDDYYVCQNLTLKEEHTYRVCENLITLGKALDLNDGQLRLGETAALFHDLGRFEQFSTYRTFDDRESENHAALSVNILKRAGVLNRLSDNEKSIIYTAIRYHNVYKIPGGLSPDILLFTRLLRDADKLDILLIVTTYYKQDPWESNPALELDLPNTNDFSPYLINDIIHNRCADGNNIRTYNDMKLLHVSWVFDINFIQTLRYIYHYDYINRIIDTLPEDDDIRKVRKHVNNYLKRTVTC